MIDLYDDTEMNDIDEETYENEMDCFDNDRRCFAGG